MEVVLESIVSGPQPKYNYLVFPDEMIVAVIWKASIVLELPFSFWCALMRVYTSS
jgi:hypothetical protein